MSQDKAPEGSNLRDELKAIDAAIAPVRHSDEDQTSGQVKKTRRAGCFVFKTRLRWAVRRSTLRWWIILTTPRGRFHLAQHQGKKDSVNLNTGLVGSRPPRSLSGGSRRAPTLVSTSTRPSLSSRCCSFLMSSHRLNSDIQELANEMKENFLRRATLLMHSHNPQDAVGGRRSTGHHPAVGHVVS